MDKELKKLTTGAVINYSPKQGYFFNAGLTLLSIIISLTPILVLNFPKVIWGGLVMLWNIEVFIFHRHRNKGFKASGFVRFIYLWFVYEIILFVLGISSAAIGNYFILLAFYDIIIKGLYVKQYYPLAYKIFFMRVFQIIILVNVIQNIVLGEIIPQIHNVDLTVYGELYAYTNLAQTEFYSMLAYFVSICVILFYKDDNKYFKIFDIAVVFLCFYFMLNYAPRATSLGISISLISLIIIYRNRKIVPLPILLLALIVFSPFMISDIAKFLVDIFPERVGLRLASLFGLSHDTTYIGRFPRMLTSLNTFFSSPISFLFGIGNHVDEDGKGVLIGQHSLLIDYLAKYGCLGLAFLVIFYKKYCHLMMLGVTRVRERRWLMIILLMLIVSSILSNPFRPEMGASLFFLAIVI